MKKIVKKIISMVLSTTCILTMTAFPAFAAETSSPADRLETGLSQLEEKYDVTIKKAPTARKASALSLEEVNSTLTDLESSLIKGQQARIENHQAYEQYMKELEESGRMDTSDSCCHLSAVALITGTSVLSPCGAVAPDQSASDFLITVPAFRQSGGLSP